jgi:TetR/AcrR family transcriptional regulator, mexCD-oprJ operon repressor
MHAVRRQSSELVLCGGQAAGVFRDDVTAEWLIAVVRAIVHVASTELQAGRLSEADVERTMPTTAFAAIS